MQQLPHIGIRHADGVAFVWREQRPAGKSLGSDNQVPDRALLQVHRAEQERALFGLEVVRRDQVVIGGVLPAGRHLVQQGQKGKGQGWAMFHGVG